MSRQLLLRLQSGLARKQRLLLRLEGERRALCATAAAGEIVLRQIEALLQLAAALRKAGDARGASGGGGGGGEHSGSSERGGNEQGGGGGGGASAADVDDAAVAAAAAAAAGCGGEQDEWWQEAMAEVSRLKHELAAAAAGPAGAAAALEPRGLRPSAAASAAESTEAWWPRGAAYLPEARAVATVEQLRAAMRAVVQQMGCLRPRIERGAPGAAETREALTALRARQLVTTAAVAVCQPHVVYAMPLGTLDDSTVGGGPSEPSEEQLAYMGRQLRLSEEQEALALAILELHARRMAAFMARREALLGSIAGEPPHPAAAAGAASGGTGGADGRGGGRPGDLGAGACVPAAEDASLALRGIEALQRGITVEAVAHAFALFAGVLTLEQYCDFTLASWPFTPTLRHTHSAIKGLAEQRAAAAARVPGPAPAGRPVGRSAGGDSGSGSRGTSGGASGCAAGPAAAQKPDDGAGGSCGSGSAAASG